MEEIKKLIDEMNQAFEAFKAENKAQIDAIKAKGHEDPLIAEKMKKITDDFAAKSEEHAKQITALKAQSDAMEKALASMDLRGGGGNPDTRVYKTLGEQLVDVYHAANPDKSDPRTMDAIARLGKVKAAATGASEGVPSDGGFLVQTDFAGMLDTTAVNTGVLSSRCFQIPISANSNGVKANLMDETSRVNGSRYGGIQAYWAVEAGTVTASKPKFRQYELNLKKLFGLFYATEELLMDSAALTAMINRWFPMEFGFKIDDAIINGTGAGMPLGILNSGCLASVSKETGQKADTIVFENIIKMYARLLDSSDANASWLINRDILPQLFTMSLAVGTGGVPVFLPASGAADRPYNTLMGKRMDTLEQCATVGDAGDIILADLNEYGLATKGGIQSAVSMHVQFIYDEMTFRWTYRCDGAPFRAAALTPYKGSATRSPFVALAARA